MSIWHSEEPISVCTPTSFKMIQHFVDTIVDIRAHSPVTRGIDLNHFNVSSGMSEGKGFSAGTCRFAVWTTAGGFWIHTQYWE